MGHFPSQAVSLPEGKSCYIKNDVKAPCWLLPPTSNQGLSQQPQTNSKQCFSKPQSTVTGEPGGDRSTGNRTARLLEIGGNIPSISRPFFFRKQIREFNMHLQYMSVLSCTYCGYCIRLYPSYLLYLVCLRAIDLWIMYIQYVKQRLNICTVVVQCACQICTTLIGGF